MAIQGYTLDGITTFWNKAYERLYGYTAEEAIGQSLLDLIIPGEMWDAVKNSMQQMKATGEPIPATELSLLEKDGSSVRVFSTTPSSTFKMPHPNSSALISTSRNEHWPKRRRIACRGNSSSRKRWNP